MAREGVFPLSFWQAEQRNGCFEKVVCGVQRVQIGGERRALWGEDFLKESWKAKVHFFEEG